MGRRRKRKEKKKQQQHVDHHHQQERAAVVVVGVVAACHRKTAITTVNFPRAVVIPSVRPEWRFFAAIIVKTNDCH